MAFIKEDVGFLRECAGNLSRARPEALIVRQGPPSTWPSWGGEDTSAVNEGLTSLPMGTDGAVRRQQPGQQETVATVPSLWAWTPCVPASLHHLPPI